MKRLISLFAIFICSVFLMSQNAYPLEILKNFSLGEGNGAGGVSYFVVDLEPYAKNGAETYSFQLSGTTELYARPSSGATIWASVATTNVLPTGLTVDTDLNHALSGNSIAEVYPWQQVISPVDVCTGNTPYPYPFVPQAGKYLIGKIQNSGTTDVTGSLYLNAHVGTGWIKPPPVPISVTYSTFSSSSGVTIVGQMISGVSGYTNEVLGYDSNLIPPAGTQWVVISTSGDDVTMTFDWGPSKTKANGGTVPVYGTTPMTITADTTGTKLPVAQYLRSAWATARLAASKKMQLEWYAQEPY